MSQLGHQVQICRSCGARYGADRFACTTCDVGLVDESRGRAVPLAEDVRATVTLRLDGWTFKQRTELVDLLAREIVRHRWADRALIVRHEDEDLVRALQSQVEGVTAPLPEPPAAMASDARPPEAPGTDEPSSHDASVPEAPPAVEPERPSTVVPEAGPVERVMAEGEEEVDEVGYELDDWLPDQQAQLVTMLAAEGIPHHWEGTEIVVPEVYADRAEELIDEIDHPDAIAPEPDDDDAGADLLGTLFVAADVLARDPADPGGVADLLDIAEVVEPAPVPYGLDVGVWDGIRRLTGELADLLAAQADEEAIVQAAKALRDALRNMV